MFQATISYFAVPAQELTLAENDLTIYTGGSVFCYVVTDQENNILAFEKYNLDLQNETIFSEFLQAKKWLTGEFNNTRIAVGSTHTTTIPDPFFDPEKLDDYLNLQYGDWPVYKCFSDFNQSGSLHTVYRLRKETVRNLFYNFPAAAVHHYQSLLLRFCEEGATQGNRLFLHFLEDVLAIVLLKDGKLQCAKTLTLRTNEECVYRILSVCKNTGIPITETAVILSGWITKDSGLYNDLYKYIPDLQFTGKPENLKMKNMEFDPHYFTIFEVIQKTP
jgi:hypothetical protein